MDRLKKLLENKLNQVDTTFKRYLYNELDFNSQLTIITGARGSGKTTLLLQYLKELNEPFSRAMYVSLDDPFFETNRLWEFGSTFYDNGGKILLLDEVHKYANWSKDIKYLYDNFDDLRIIATGSSILDLKQGEADLSRRTTTYHLYGLSLREYLNARHKLDLPTFKLSEILKDHTTISNSLADRVDPLMNFKTYLKEGYFPFFLREKKQYLERLVRTTKLAIEIDIPAFEQVDYQTIRGLKKLLYILSQSVPFKPNISKLSARIDTSRNLLLKMLDLMSRADLLLLLRSDVKGISLLSKPEKIFLQNTNLQYALSDVEPNKGQIRETFFFNQLVVKHHISPPKFGDFMVDGQWVFEIGGASKTKAQISGVPNSFVAADDVKFSSGNRIPLWLFGFLY